MSDSEDFSKTFVKLKGDAEVAEAYSFLDAQRRRALARDWHLSGMGPNERAGHKRAIKHIVRKPKKYDAERAKLTTQDLVILLREMRPSPVLDHVFPERNLPGKWLKYDMRTSTSESSPTEVDLHTFSFLDAPQDCLEGLAEIALHEATKISVRVNFKDQYCLDVVPYMLLTEFWSDMLPIFKGGEMDVPMQKVLAAIGIEEDLRVGFQGIEDFNDVWAFPLTRRRKKGDSRSRSIYFDVPSRDHASDRFCDALDNWLNRPEFKMELTQSGRGYIKELLGELLENAERHSDGKRRDGAWTVAGFLAKRLVGGEQRFIAHIGIVSLGDTFVESLERATDEQKSNLNDYISLMTKLGAPQSKATLMTLAALQDGVTCVPEADLADRGGYGLMQMLQLTNILGATENSNMLPEITIVSGSSCVQLKTPYFSCETVAGHDAARVQWCNQTNSAKVVPDVKHVFDLEKGLPGTAISIRFILDPQYLQKVMEGLKDGRA